MPRIKEYTNQVGGPQDLPLAQVTRQAYASDFNGAGVGASMLGNAIEKGANDLTTAYRLQEEAKARQEVTDAAVELSRFHASAEHELRNAKTSGALDDDSYTEQFMARISTNLDSVGTKFQTAQGRQAWERGSAATQAHYLVAAGEAQSQMAGVKAVANFKDFVSNSSNAVMANPFNFEQTEQSVSSVIRDPKGVFGKLPAEKVDELALMAKQQLAQSAAQGVIRMDPSLGMELLTKGKYDSYLNPDAKHALITEARVGIAGQEAEARRQEAEAKRQRKKEVQEINKGMVEKWASHSLTVPDVLNSNLPATGDGSQEHWISQINAQAKEAKRNAEDQTHPEAVRGLMLQIHANEDDPKKTYNMDAVNADYQAGNISTKEYTMLRTEVEQLRDGTTNGFQRDVQSARNTVNTTFSRSIMGQVEPEKAADASYRFTVDLNNAVEEKRKNNEDPRTLLDPKSKDYMLSPERLKTYMKSPAQAMADEAAKVKAGEVTASFKDYDTLPPGTLFTDPQGNVRRKPEDEGIITPGNIDLSKRVPVDNGDGTFSTVISASFEIDGNTVLLPTLDPKGRQMTDNEALTRYEETGKHLGIFKNEAAATAYAKKASKGQEALYPQAAAAARQQQPTALQQSVQEVQNAIQRLPGNPIEEPAMLDPNGPIVEPSMLDPNGPSMTPGHAYLKGSQTHQQAVASLEQAVKTMPGKEPIMVEPRKHGESAADFLKRWNEANK